MIASEEPEARFEDALPITQGNFSAPPANRDAEASLLGCCLLDGGVTAAFAVSRGVTGRSFVAGVHRLIWETIQTISGRNDAVEVSVIAAMLQAQGRLSPEVTQTLFSLDQHAPTTAAAPTLTDSVLSLERRRDAIQTARLLITAAEDMDSEIDLALADAQRRLRPPPSRTAAPFQLWTPDQFIAHVPDASACLLGDGFIERGEWTSLVGIGGLGKTRLALYFAICQILKQEFCGLPTKGEPQHTIILSTENGLRRWKSDLEKFYLHLTELQRATLNTHLRIQALTAQDDADLNLGIPETVARLKSTLSLKPAAGLVIFDPFADMVDGDENKTTDLVQTLQTLRRLTSNACPEAAVLIIHHARTGAMNVAQAGDNYNAGNFGRGSKALFSKVRCELQLAPQDRDDPTRLVLACGKANNTVKFETRGLSFDPENFSYSIDSDFDVEAWRADVAGKRKETALSIKELVSGISETLTFSGAEISTKAICTIFDDLNVPTRTLQRLISKACNSGYLRFGNKRGMWRLGAKPV